MSKLVYCACGCGKVLPITTPRSDREPARYIRGHNMYDKVWNKGKITVDKSTRGKVYCECGCGQLIKPQRHHRYYGTPKYIASHAPRTYWLGKTRSDEDKLKMSLARKGKSTRGWTDEDCKKHVTKTPIYKRIRQSFKFKDWRRGVFERDDWTCQKCKQRGGKLNAHHIHNFIDYPNLRFELINGISLCVQCHKTFHHIFGYKFTTQIQLNEFLKNE